MWRFADFMVLVITLFMAQMWSDGNPLHKWLLFGAVIATNLLSYFRAYFYFKG